MAGDCPHNAHLKASLQHSHDSNQFMAATHEKYLKIIDELKNDLNEMSLEVVKVQQECRGEDEKLLATENNDLVTSLKELETQNDRLEEALKEANRMKDDAATELKTNNETLKCQINHLEKVLEERDNYIQHLKTSSRQHMQTCPSSVMSFTPAVIECCSSKHEIAEMKKRIDGLSVELDKSRRQENFLLSKSRQLHEEVNEHKRRNGSLVAKAHHLAGLQKCRDAHHMLVTSQYQDLQHSFDDQAKKLKAANGQLIALNEKFERLQKLHAENNIERDLLHKEIYGLKEKEAIVVGRLKSIQEQLKKTEMELGQAHKVMKEQQCLMKKNEVSHANLLRQLKDENMQIKGKLGKLFEDHRRLRQEREIEKEIVAQYEKTLDTFRQWKECQLEEEKKIRQQFQEYEQKISGLEAERDNCIATFQSLYQDYIILQDAFEKSKQVKFRDYKVMYPTEGQLFADQEVAEKLHLIRQTVKRLSQHSSYLQNEAGCSHQPQTQTDTQPPEQFSEKPPTEKKT